MCFVCLFVCVWVCACVCVCENKTLVPFAHHCYHLPECSEGRGRSGIVLWEGWSIFVVRAFIPLVPIPPPLPPPPPPPPRPLPSPCSPPILPYCCYCSWLVGYNPTVQNNSSLFMEGQPPGIGKPNGGGGKGRVVVVLINTSSSR